MWILQTKIKLNNIFSLLLTRNFFVTIMNQTHRSLCGCVCRPHSSWVTPGGVAAAWLVFSLPQLTIKYSSDIERKISHQRPNTFTISHFYLFICLFFIYFFIFLNIKHKTAIKERALVKPVKSAMYQSPSESFFIFLSALLVSVLSILQPISPVSFQ